MSQDAKVTLSSGNVFADLEVRRPEEELAKADLAFQIRQIIRDRRLTQQEADQILGIGQARVSDIMKGKVRSFTFDRLFRCLTALDRSVRIEIGEHSRGKDRPHYTVEAT